jgi:methyl-accepting chemotaxis protein
MKINMPVTDREVVMKDGTILVTRTDTKGRITYANDDFVEISGFSRDELIGKNHNIVRHPDMPAEAFEDLWTTSKQAKPWKGIVKNRTKTGDYYWVEANVTPVFNNGQVVEYLSVRYAPSREQINAAESLYQQVQSKKATLTPTGMAAKLKMIREMPLHFKAALAMLALLIPDGFLMFQLYQQQLFTALFVVALQQLSE